DRVANVVWELRPPQITALLEKRLADSHLFTKQRSRIFDIVAGYEDPDAGKLLLKAYFAERQPEIRDRILANLKLYLPTKWKNLRSSAELAAAVTRLLSKKETRIAGLALIGASERKEAVPQVTAIARDASDSLATRMAAVQTLGLLKT